MLRVKPCLRRVGLPRCLLVRRQISTGIISQYAGLVDGLRQVAMVRPVYLNSRARERRFLRRPCSPSTQ